MIISCVREELIWHVTLVLIGQRVVFVTTCYATMLFCRRSEWEINCPSLFGCRAARPSLFEPLQGVFTRRGSEGEKNAIGGATGNAQLSVCSRGAAQLCSAGTGTHVVLEPQQRAERLFFPSCCVSTDKHLEALPPAFTFNPLRLFTPR